MLDSSTYSFVSPALGWALTYLAHSTLLLGLCWLAARLARRGGESGAEEGLWKAALLAGVATTLLQGALGVDPLAGRFSLLGEGTNVAVETPHRADGAASREAHLPGQVSLVPGAMADGRQDRPTTPITFAVTRESSAAVDLELPSAIARETVVSPVRGGGAASALLVGWLLAAGALAVRLVIANLRLAQRLRDRRPCADPEAAALLARLRREAGVSSPVALTVSDRLLVPIARGLRRPEICLPARALAELDHDELAAVVAHELAHVARRDALWQLAARALEVLLPFQPLHRVARRRLSHLFELASDEWASRLTGQPLALARSLAKVAGWTLGEDGRGAWPGLEPSVGVSALAATPSTLGERVRRLVGGRLARPHSSTPWLGLVAVVVATTLFTAPAFTGTSAPAAPQTQAPKVRPVPPQAPEPVVAPTSAIEIAPQTAPAVPAPAAPGVPFATPAPAPALALGVPAPAAAIPTAPMPETPVLPESPALAPSPGLPVQGVHPVLPGRFESPPVAPAPAATPRPDGVGVAPATAALPRPGAVSVAPAPAAVPRPDGVVVAPAPATTSIERVPPVVAPAASPRSALLLAAPRAVPSATRPVRAPRVSAAQPIDEREIEARARALEAELARLEAELAATQQRQEASQSESLAQRQAELAAVGERRRATLNEAQAAQEAELAVAAERQRAAQWEAQAAQEAVLAEARAEQREEQRAEQRAVAEEQARVREERSLSEADGTATRERERELARRELAARDEAARDEVARAQARDERDRQRAFEAGRRAAARDTAAQRRVERRSGIEAERDQRLDGRERQRVEERAREEARRHELRERERDREAAARAAGIRRERLDQTTQNRIDRLEERVERLRRQLEELRRERPSGVRPRGIE